jgi:hypothetical protein
MIKKIGVLGGLLAAHNSNAFMTPHSKTIALSPKNRITTSQLSQKIPSDDMPSDDMLFKDLFETHAKEANQYTLLTELEYYARDMTIRPLIRNIEKNIISNDDDISKDIPLGKDTELTSFSYLHKPDDICNDIYIDKGILKNNKALKKTCDDLGTTLKTLIDKTQFDTDFMPQKQFVQRINNDIYPKIGFVLRGMHQGKDVYFLMTRTYDNNLRLFDVSRSQYQLGETF